MEDLKETVTRQREFQLDQQKSAEEMFLLQQQKADERTQKTESLLQALISRDQTLESYVAFPQKCLNCEKVGHKSLHCKSHKNKNRVHQARSNQKYENNIHKYVLVKILNKEVKLQLDSGSDLTIINLHTWWKFNKATTQKTSKTAKAVTGTKIKFEGELITKVTFNGIPKKKLKLFVLKNTENLFGTDWIQEFN